MPESLLSVVIPAYNEEESLPRYLPEVLAFVEANDMQLIVVNDGSSDKTTEILAGFNDNRFLSVVSHKKNRGYGGALKSGILASKTKYTITIDADGQHYLEDVLTVLKKTLETDADMIIGSRKGLKSASWYREIGKRLIRWIANILMPLDIYDINSGMKIYNTAFAQKYLPLCPNSMAFSDTIALVFISQRHLVLEEPIRIKERIGGESTISTRTAFETVLEILNMVVLFNPLRIFLPLALMSGGFGMFWGLYILLVNNKGVSTLAVLAIITGLLLFFLGLLAEQISLMRKAQIEK